ncbi:SDR family oxidoreductase [Lapillicoccus jejuensis]|uniref:NAD(P)H dehydrogenase (Quinone) n=1 Tax=Lapillicoccus jejuensis TaxID=402171 RepID=A0A542DZR5_9MICO|nr:SDR family oxidoreductase [Lapillicoccus jejuensis]TQJ08585.1 NAD(P)H dehydrogenase (quinone) [Lapillicoccus jejuensis]
MTTIAITAATGQLGRLVLDALLTRVPASDVVAVVRDGAKAADLAERGVDVRVASYDDPAALTAAFAGVDRLLFVSGNEFGSREQQHRNVVAAAKEAGVGHVAYTSVLAAPTSTLPVAPDHVVTEQVLAESGLPHTFLRNGWYHENYLGAPEQAKATGTVLTSAGDGRVASAARADYAEAAAVVLTTPVADLPEVYELSGDEAWTQDDLAAVLSRVTGTPVTVTRVDADGQREALTAAGVPEGGVFFAVATDAGTARGDLALQTGDLSRLIGRPTATLEQTLRTAS